MGEWKERGMNCLLLAAPHRSLGPYSIAYVIGAVLERNLPQKETRDQSTVSLSRVTAVRDLSSTLASLLPPYSLTPLLPSTLLLFLLRMARLALFSIVLLSLSLSANAASSQQPIAYPDGSVRTTEGWSWTDCGQSSV